VELVNAALLCASSLATSRASPLGPSRQGYALGCARTYVSTTGLHSHSVRSLLPVLLKFNIATEDEVDIDNLATRFREEVAGQNGVVMLSPFVSVWAVKR